MRFLGLLVFLVLLNVALVSSFRAYGKTKALSSELQKLNLDRDNRQLYFLDIKPGTTTLQQAQNILLNAGARHGDQETIYNFDKILININFDPLNHIVRQISIKNKVGTSFPLMLGDIIRTLGVPCSLSGDTLDQKNLILIYPFAYVVVDLNLQRIKPSMPVNEVSIPSATIECDGNLAWLGFTTSAHYRKYD